MMNILFLLIILISQPACEMLGIQDSYPLLTAAQNGDMIAAKELLRENAAVNSVSEEQRFALLEASSNGNTALHMAAVKANHEMLMMLIENVSMIALKGD